MIGTESAALSLSWEKQFFSETRVCCDGQQAANMCVREREREREREFVSAFVQWEWRTHALTCVFVSKQARVYVCVRVHVCVPSCICMLACVCVYVCVCVCVPTCVCVCVCAHMCVCVCAHMCVCICVWGGGGGGGRFPFWSAKDS